MSFKPRMIENAGMTIIQKFDPSTRKDRPSKVALVLAGGAVSGGGYKAGGIRALNDYLVSRKDGEGRETPYTINDFDTYIGLSAGSILSAVLAAGIPPAEVFRILDGTSEEFEKFSWSHFMTPNFTEPVERLKIFSEGSAGVVSNYLRGEENPFTEKPYNLQETLIKLITMAPRLVPTGFFDNESLGDYLANAIERFGLPNNFVEAYKFRKKELYFTAVDLNTGEKVVFGHDQKYRDVSISDAIRASCGLPIWYKTVRIKNPLYGRPGERKHLDLADGGVVRTANVRMACDRGADLVIVYNPFRRIVYNNPERSLYEHGVYALVSQMFRILLGSRLAVSKRAFFNDPNIKSDIIYIEPSGDDYIFFLMNPLNFWSRQKAVEHGYITVKREIDTNYDKVQEIFANHGVSVTKDIADRSADLLAMGHHEDSLIQAVIESAPRGSQAGDKAG